MGGHLLSWAKFLACPELTLMASQKPPYLLDEEVEQSQIFTRKMEFFSCQLRQVADLLCPNFLIRDCGGSKHGVARRAL